MHIVQCLSAPLPSAGGKAGSVHRKMGTHMYLSEPKGKQGLNNQPSYMLYINTEYSHRITESQNIHIHLHSHSALIILLGF